VVPRLAHRCKLLTKLRTAVLPGGVARTSTQALTHATLPYVAKLAGLGWREAITTDPGLAAGVNVHDGRIVHAAVAQALGEPYIALA
jgi:alanine dehydrogenase